ncbi:uncharacterized protein LOC122394613 [Amphibalanus amphitrite]|uniref:uncharacterized protein LOC122394613 n=1 Tax=Amphibalanus amphitrite TaxID=1232801 RepID=UPI001C91FC12|nr:uncharacterized protein LOC122394613 [Amphibalanus amphitrite]
MTSPVAVLTCLLAVSATCLLSQLRSGMERHSGRAPPRRVYSHKDGSRRNTRSAGEDDSRLQLDDVGIGARAACPFTTETVTLGDVTMTASTCVSAGGPCAGGVPFTVCQQLTQTVLVDGRAVELNTACLCALRARTATTERSDSVEAPADRQRRDVAVPSELPHEVWEHIIKMMDYVVFCVSQLIMIYHAE